MISAPLQPVLARATALLERGRGTAAAELLEPLLQSRSVKRQDEFVIRAALTEACLLQGDVERAATVLGRVPDQIREPLPQDLLSSLWRLHGRVAYVRGEQSRAIALQTRALKHAEAAHDSRGIGLAHFELVYCYQKVGDHAIVREHLTEAAAALHAAGDRRHLAQVHSVSGVMHAQQGRYDDATAALRNAERLATALGADDVLALAYVNQAAVAQLRRRYDQAITLAERAVALHESTGQPHRLAAALATLGHIRVKLGHLGEAEQALRRALGITGGVQAHEITGAVHDTLAQIALMRGDYEAAAESLTRAAEAFGAYGRETSKWYEWSVRVITARLANRRGRPDEALALADSIVAAEGAPPAERLDAELIAAEALLLGERSAETAARIAAVEGRINPRTTPGAWGEFLRVRGQLHAREGRPNEAYHDIAQSVSVFELVGERYQSALSHLALGRLAREAGARSTADRHLTEARDEFAALGSHRDFAEAEKVLAEPPARGSGIYLGSPADADDALVQRLVNASVLPDLLAHELVTAVREAVLADVAVVFVTPAAGEVRLVAHAGGDPHAARTLALAAATGGAYGAQAIVVRPLGTDPDGPRALAVASARPWSDLGLRRARMMAAVAQQGFDLCAARERPTATRITTGERPLEPLLAGFICASPAMQRVVEQVQRLQGNDLTVLITGESGTGKELVARAIHVGSLRSAATFLPYNCTTTTRELADTQLFGHRRGAFTGAVNDQPGLIRAAAGGTLFLDEVGDLPFDVQPKLLRFLEESEILPVGATKPQQVDVRVLAATNADLEQRVSEGKFREDLYYRLSVIRIHIPPLRQRSDEIPHMATFFLREAADRLAKPDVRLSPEVLSLFATYWWPGNVRQLRNEVQRAVALAAPGSTVIPEHLSPDLTTEAPTTQNGAGGVGAGTPRLQSGQTLANLVDEVERALIEETLAKSAGNIAESARTLGLTRRGLYLKLKRLGLDPAGLQD
ncbi:MAG TPA: sigma 54-interacting transcriptional regulator [Vicinamibacterales bacterium]|nr:sigma 54-interacting transcriptional regulator [Vicinamibacterales bacterium]